METFRKGDFIRLKEFNKWEILRCIEKDVNVFEIHSIHNSDIIITECKVKISLADIEPIPINGKDDLYIYYDSMVCAPFVGRNNPAPVIYKDYSYFFESFKRCIYENRNYQEIITDLGLKYVHEVQHFLEDKFNDNGLRINAL